MVEFFSDAVITAGLSIPQPGLFLFPNPLNAIPYDLHLLTKARKVAFKFENAADWTIDGESAGCYKDVDVEVVGGAFNIVC